MLDERAPSQPVPTAKPAPKVLIVDDDAASRRLLSTSLRSAGFELSIAIDGAEALAAIEVSPPDLLVLDFEMPGFDGAEVCRRLRASERVEINQLPIIMLTGHTAEIDEIACLKAGANDFVTKPISRAVLVARIETQLRLGALTEELRMQNSEMARWREAQEADFGVWNLVSNAIKFTPHGGHVEISVARALEVRDNGRGISPGFLPRIFDCFSQQDAFLP